MNPRKVLVGVNIQTQVYLELDDSLDPNEGFLAQQLLENAVKVPHPERCGRD